MQDAESKVALLCYYVESVARIACAIPSDYVARLYGRSLFLGVDAFLVLAPRLKNEMRATGRLTHGEADSIKNQINKLRTDYEGYYATVRDKIAAHQQKVDLVQLLETWNEIDAATLTILSEDVAAIWMGMQRHGATSSFQRPPELDDPATLLRFASLYDVGGVRMGLDRVAATRRNTATIIPLGAFQEKAMRVVTAFDGFRSLVATGLEQITANWLLPDKACVDLFAADACSVIDNIFEDRPATTQVVAEESLVKMWKAKDVTGIERLEKFHRDAALELQLRELRNKFSAHVDADIPLAELIKMLIDFPRSDLSDYLASIYSAFKEVCLQDIRTRLFLIHGQEINGIVAVAETRAVKPFR